MDDDFVKTSITMFNGAFNSTGSSWKSTRVNSMFVKSVGFIFVKPPGILQMIGMFG